MGRTRIREERVGSSSSCVCLGGGGGGGGGGGVVYIAEGIVGDPFFQCLSFFFLLFVFNFDHS